MKKANHSAPCLGALLINIFSPFSSDLGCRDRAIAIATDLAGLADRLGDLRLQYSGN